MLVTKQLTVAIDFHSMGKNTMEVSGYRQLFGYQHSSKCVQQKKEIHIGLEQVEGE